MPIADTEFLFALNPKDRRHDYAIRLLKELNGLMVPDTAVLEFQAVLRARGRSPSQVRMALLALHDILMQNGVKEVKTLSLSLLAFQSELEDRYGLSYFDSLIAASALTLDRQVVSDDEAFDRVSNLKRIPLSSTK
ncbi:PIN domain-containing protein [Candidatus Bathyarchaeota archaeon]|nr:PIN domain-containing protein [Candidatus Bathyarchaeota archaeon]MBS7613992.1 PIN domain-containing protein [Candidatus Bathyarchaeota archaeon]MBS7618983.1 PIN domain-containing protein [Candidatus Bathyarchaeota archaeon]